MKKIIVLVLLVLALTLVFTACGSDDVEGGGGGSSEKLVIYNWADYMDLTIQDEFCAYYEEVTGNSLEIIYSTFDTNEVMLTQILKGEATVDLICPSEYAIQRLFDNNMLQPVDMTRLPEGVEDLTGNVNQDIITSIDDTFQDKTDANGVKMSSYLVPYMWGTLGVLYNCNYVTEEQLEESGWGIFWNTLGIEEIDHRITLKDSVRDVYVAAVLYLKEQGRLPEEYDALSVQELINTVDDTLLALVEEALQEQKTVLKGYEVDEGKSDVIKEETYVSLAWSGDAMWVIELAAEDEVEIGYYVPEIGSNIWFDGWVMPKNAQNTTAATMFINYCCDPEIAMRNQVEIGYTSAVRKEVLQESEAAMEYLIEEYEFEDEDYAEEYDLADPDDLAYLLDEEEAYISASFFADEGRYADIAESEGLGVMRDFGAKGEDAVKMWSHVKSYAKFPWEALVVAVCVLAAIAGAIALYYVVLNRKKSRKYIER